MAVKVVGFFGLFYFDAGTITFPLAYMLGDVLTEIYSNAYIVVVPSDIEGMSLSLLEALSYGNAVLCSDIPENTLVTEDKAIHFKKSNVFDLTQKLQILCDDENKVKKIRIGVDDYILSKYNWNDVALATSNLYKRVSDN
jgi:glycosyltransferase involved in cell wall biosynthesis